MGTTRTESSVLTGPKRSSPPMLQRVPHRDGLVDQVHVRPAQSEQLATAQAERQRQRVHGVPAVTVHRLEELLRLLRRPRDEPRPLPVRDPLVLRHVADHQLVKHGVLQDHTQQPVSTLLRSLPNPLPAGTRPRDARPAGPPPRIPDTPPAVQRRASCRGSIEVAWQRIHVGMVHAGATVDIHPTDTTWRILLDDELLLEAPRTADRPVARFKAHKPEPPRPARRP
jgi:hypothetical protein